MHNQFETWFVAQPFYNKLIYIHGERLFIRRNDEYQILTVEVAYQAYKSSINVNDDLFGLIGKWKVHASRWRSAGINENSQEVEMCAFELEQLLRGKPCNQDN